LKPWTDRSNHKKSAKNAKTPRAPRKPIRKFLLGALGPLAFLALIFFVAAKTRDVFSAALSSLRIDLCPFVQIRGSLLHSAFEQTYNNG